MLDCNVTNASPASSVSLSLSSSDENTLKASWILAYAGLKVSYLILSEF